MFLNRYLKNHSGRTHGHGFTLLELLMVIAIIVLLAGLLLPALNHAKKSAKSLQCVNNLKNITLATHQYINDYNDFFPPYIQEHSWTWNWPWGLKDGGYINTPDTFRCPIGMSLLTYSYTNGADDIIHCPNSRNAYYGIAYGYNYYYLGLNQSLGSFPTFKRSNVKNPSSKILFADSYNSTGDLLSNSNYCVIIYTMSDYGAIHDRHNLGANIAWVDGHVSWIKQARLNMQTGAWGETAKYWNPTQP